MLVPPVSSHLRSHDPNVSVNVSPTICPVWGRIDVVRLGPDWRAWLMSGVLVKLACVCTGVAVARDWLQIELDRVP